MICQYLFLFFKTQKAKRSNLVPVEGKALAQAVVGQRIVVAHKHLICLFENIKGWITKDSVNQVRRDQRAVLLGGPDLNFFPHKKKKMINDAKANNKPLGPRWCHQGYANDH